jgi:hypothetical protein
MDVHVGVWCSVDGQLFTVSFSKPQDAIKQVPAHLRLGSVLTSKSSSSTTHNMRASDPTRGSETS